MLTNQTNPTASPVGGLLTLCVASGSPTVHGTFTAMYNSLGQARSVNTLPLEQYVADTVPGESPSSWASLGGAGPQGMNWGFQELEAQAVAVRSYVLANLGGYGGYADTCDLTCQTYRGTQYETPTSIAAANDTAGQVMVMPGGQIATTEYSASTGGYTSSSNQQSPFTAVPDDGDAVTAGGGNPNHNWSTTVSAAQIQSALPQIGTFLQIQRTDLGPRPSVRLPLRAGCHHHPRRIPAADHRSGDGVLRGPRAQVGPLRPHIAGRHDRHHRRTGLGARHRHGPVGRARLRHRSGPRGRQLDVQPDREPLLRSGHAAEPAGWDEPGRRPAQWRGRRLLDQRLRRRASSASATRSSTAARAGCASTSRWSPWPRRTTPRGTGRSPATAACSASATRSSTGAPGASA